MALAAGPSGPLVTSFGEVAPLALMSGSIQLLQAWVIEILGALAADDEQRPAAARHAAGFPAGKRQRHTTAERLVLHKNTVQYRVRRCRKGWGVPC